MYVCVYVCMYVLYACMCVSVCFFEAMDDVVAVSLAATLFVYV
jgi:hypothetical protein